MTAENTIPSFPDWTREFPGAVTVCDTDGRIISMNQRACETFAKYGGESIIGKNLVDCHPEPSRTKLRNLLANPGINTYTIEKKGVKKLIFQAPWFREGVFSGLVELSLIVPIVMPHFKRN